MATTHDRIVQAEEGVANLQNVLDHTQSALAVAEQVEVAARKSRRLLKILAVLVVVGIVILVVRKVTASSDEDPDPDRDDAQNDHAGPG